MKRLFITTLGLLLLHSVCSAGLITHTDYTSQATITAAGQNANENAIFNEFNGNIESTNIKDGTIALADLSSSLQTTINSIMPVGMIAPYAAATAPTGWLICDGTAVSRTTYSGLYAIVGITFGQGNGTTTFNLPDFRGKFLRGYDNAAGNDPDRASRTACNTGGNTGDNVGSCQADQFKSHTHTVTVTDPGHTHQMHEYTTTGSNGLNPTGQTGSEQGASPTSGPIVTNTTGITAAANASTGGNESRGINVTVQYIIKY